MELRQLETFARVVQCRSFTQAAEDLSLTQPAVTRQIAALERTLNTRLLERMGRRIQLTAAGEALYRYALEMLRLAQEAERAVADVASGAGGRLAVGANSTTAAYVLPPLLRRFHETYPGVELSVHTGVSARIIEMVMQGEVDVGVATEFHQQSGLVEIPLTDYATGVVVYPEHPLAQVKGDVRAEELAGSPLILMEAGTNLRTVADRLLSAAGVQEQITLELDNVEAIKKMIEARLGISLLPLIAVADEVAAGRLAARSLADVPNANRRIVAIHRQDKYLSAVLRAFLALLKGAFATPS